MKRRPLINEHNMYTAIGAQWYQSYTNHSRDMQIVKVVVYAHAFSPLHHQPPLPLISNHSLSYHLISNTHPSCHYLYFQVCPPPGLTQSSVQKKEKATTALAGLVVYGESPALSVFLHWSAVKEKAANQRRPQGTWTAMSTISIRILNWV